MMTYVIWLICSWRRRVAGPGFGIVDEAELFDSCLSQAALILAIHVIVSLFVTFQYALRRVVVRC